MRSNDFFIGLELTRHCNLRCKHCLRCDLHKFAELPKDFIESILDQAKVYNTPHIAITGGEPTLHRQFKEIIELIVAKGYRFHFVTNGYNFRDTWSKIDHLAGGHHWDGISISVDGATEMTHDGIRGKGSYRRALSAIAACKIHGLFVTVQMVVNGRNRHEMRAMAELCSSFNIDRLYFAHMQPTVRALREGIFLDAGEWEKIDQEILRLKQDYRIPIQQSAGFYDLVPLSHCKFLRNGALNIDYRGRLTVCCQLSNTGADGDIEKDVVCDLNEVSLVEGHRMLLDVYNEIHHARLAKMQQDGLQKMDSYHCWQCMKHFKKVDWLAEKYPENSWVKADVDLSSKDSAIEVTTKQTQV